jgi:hypothetical protein
MTQTLTGLFDRYDDARLAIQHLEAAGVPHRDLSLLANDARGERAPNGERASDGARAAGEDAGRGAGVGAAIGGLGGLLAGLGLLAVPGLGPVVAAGWLASAAAGAVGVAVVGGATGGLVGALTRAGVPEDDAHIYAEGVRRGGTLVAARVAEDLTPIARAVLSKGEMVDLRARRELYRNQGWTRFDGRAPAYTADQIDAERRLHRV